jgi:hypothetical protein
MSARALFNAGICVYPEIWTDQEISSVLSGIAHEYCRNSGELMQGYAQRPPGVTPETGDADERQACFDDSGKNMVEHSVRVIVPFRGVVKPPWRPVPGQPAGNPGQRLNSAVAFFPSRASPAGGVAP